MSVVTTPLHTGRARSSEEALMCFCALGGEHTPVRRADWLGVGPPIQFTSHPFAGAKVRQEKAGWKRIPTGVKFLKVSRKELSVFAPRRKVFRKIRKVFESFSGVL